ncbi:uncharacterized protein yc1106_01186 [Curvularia clavata]|uniref:Uncharacterized protein n=1 Tax=Curvularia clavata TaxID=95742 RepID=A0A9Q9DNW3_CURCL|nr:uncharacterized protein yc1106_01186 [Curvularia clavata]
MERRSMQERRLEPHCHHQGRHSIGDFAKGLNQQLGRHTSSRRKSAEPHQPLPNQSRALSPLEIEQLPQQAFVSAYLRSSYHGENVDHQGRLSSSPESYYTPSSSQHHPPSEIRRISGNFNAPTEIEVERQRSQSRRSRGMGKIKDAVKDLIRV